MKILALGNNGTWGRGDTIQEAKAQAIKVGGRAKKYIAYSCEDDTAEIDGMGNIVYEPGTTNTYLGIVK